MVSVVLSRSRVAGDMKVDRIGICRNRVISHILEREPHKLPISIRQDESITSRHGEIDHASKHGGRTSTRHHATSSATSTLCPRHPLIPRVHRDLLYQPPVRPRQNHRNRHPSPHLRYLPKCRAVGLVRYRIHTGSTVMIFLLGKAYGTFDNKWVFIACLLNFALASALCGTATNMDAMIVGRVWAGAGGAGMYLATLNLSTALSMPSEHSLYVGVTGFVYGSGCIMGPIVGGLLADSAATWRWVP
jgi:hypothetical protein